MKAIVCELCGSNELIKTEGVFVCQHCGTKYSVEEAKKLFVEISGPVTVKVEQTPVSEYISKAKQALKSGMRDAAKKYIEDAFNADPMDGQVVLLRAIINSYDEYSVAEALTFLKSHNGEHAVNEILSLWNDAIGVRCDNHQIFWDGFEHVFPEQAGVICQYAVPAWKKAFEGAMDFYCNKSDEWSIYHAPDTYNKSVKRYEQIRRYDPDYNNPRFESDVAERDAEIQENKERMRRANSYWGKRFGEDSFFAKLFG